MIREKLNEIRYLDCDYSREKTQESTRIACVNRFINYMYIFCLTFLSRKKYGVVICWWRAANMHAFLSRERFFTAQDLFDLVFEICALAQRTVPLKISVTSSKGYWTSLSRWTTVPLACRKRWLNWTFIWMRLKNLWTSISGSVAR